MELNNEDTGPYQPGKPMGFLQFLDESQLQTIQQGENKDNKPREDKPEKEKKKAIKASNFEKLVRKTGIDVDTIGTGRNFDILLTVLKFTTKQNFKKPKPKSDEGGDEDEDEPHYKVYGKPEVIDNDCNAPLSMLMKTEDSLIVDPNAKKLFKSIEFSGKGGFGSVFFAVQASDKNRVAIKKMDNRTEKEVLFNLSEIAFLRACNHPNIVSLLKAYKVRREIWLVMEFMEGGTLAEAVKSYDFKEPQVLKALKYLHEKNFVHRDLKSSNIMMTVQGDIKLIDFGLCTDISNGPKVHLLGSPFWIPPEMIAQEPHGWQADIWSFAVCLIEMHDKHPPNKDSKLRALYVVATEGLDSYLQKANYSAAFKEFLSLCLKLNPSERASAAELLQHPFLQKADTRKSMESILANIFINKTMTSVF